MQRDVRAIVDGALGGTLGTVTMSVVMLAAQKLGYMGGQPPELITAAALEASGADGRDRKSRDVLATLVHFAFGIGTGSVFALLHRRLRLPIGAIPHGMVFATLVWVVSYKGWVPALRIMPPPEKDRPGRPIAMLIAHWVYGLTVGAFVSQRPEDATS